MACDTTSMDVHNVLEVLEQNNSNYHIPRTQLYEKLQSLLDKDEKINTEVLKRILTICISDIATLMYSPWVVSMISTIISRVQMGKYNPAPDLLPSALAVIGVIKKISSVNKVDSLLVLSYRTLLSYPEHILTALADYHDEVMEVFKLYCHIRIPLSTRMETYNLLLKLLQILSQENKRLFVAKGIYVWFSKVIPTIIYDQTGQNIESRKSLELLELLTNELVHINYIDDPYWHSILKCICDKKQYPATMKNLLEAGDDAWHKLWIVFVKLLKHQVTQSVNGLGVPINHMLPVVEVAFKLDAKSRCLAFECWMVLIDSLSVDSITSDKTKTMNLLLIPLKATNARTQEVISVKFKCWWHLFVRFQNKMDNLLDKVLTSFFSYCILQLNALDKEETRPGLIATETKKLYNEAIVNLLGHVNCEGCTDLPQLNGKIINTKHLVANWKLWLIIMKSVIKSLNCDYGLTKQQITCLWKSFITTIAELSENNIRRDLFIEIISIITASIQNSNVKSLDIVFNVLLLSLFDGDEKVKQLFISDNSAINKFINIIFNESLHSYYKCLTGRELVTKLKTISNLLFDDNVCAPEQIIGDVLSSLPSNDIALLLWASIAECLCKTDNEEHVNSLTHSVLLWPLKPMHIFSEVKIAAETWYSTYNYSYPKLKISNIDEKISIALLSMPDNTFSAVYFKLYVVLAVLKNKYTEDNSSVTYENKLDLLLKLTKCMNTYEDYSQIFPVLVERIVDILTTVTTNVNNVVTPIILISANNVLNVLSQAYINKTDVAHVSLLIEKLLTSIDKLIAIESYSHLLPNMTLTLLNYFSLLSAHLPTQQIVLSILNKLLAMTNITDENYNQIKSLIDTIETGNSNAEVEGIQKLEEYELPSPRTQKVPNRKKTKEPNIVKTVVENGEEYVVVKSNWKFNPRRLTENQKEKLQRKREDIPALYQDLSQSQDEVRLVAWRTDTQDNTSSSTSVSKTGKSDDKGTTSEILKNLPSTNVVPRILENLISVNESSNTIAKTCFSKDEKSRLESSNAISKDTKSPRMSLKDRVFRNVRNLIENSGVHKENQKSIEDPNWSDIPITPTHAKQNKLDSVYSAPSALFPDRPSRMKRKPKKFDDLLLLGPKRNRCSLQDKNTNNAERIDNTTQICDIPSIDLTTPSAISTLNDNITPSKSNEETILISTPSEDVKERITAPITKETENITVPESGGQHVIEVLTAEQPKESPMSNECNDLNNITIQNLPQNVLHMPSSNEPNEYKDGLGQSNENKESILTPSFENKLPSKKSKSRKSRLENELAIDMVEGHPYLKTQPVKRFTRKSLESVGTRRLKIARKLNKTQSASTGVCNVKGDKKTKRKDMISSTPVVVNDSQNKDSVPREQSCADELLCSDDVIESSQDSTITTISVKSSKTILKKVPVICLKNILTAEAIFDKHNSQSIIERTAVEINQSLSNNQESSDDIVLPLNKTAVPQISQKDVTTVEEEGHENVTENMDTAPLDEKDIFENVTIVSENTPDVKTVGEDCTISLDTQEIAEADTQPTDFSEIMDINVTPNDVTGMSELSVTKVVCDSELGRIENQMQTTVPKEINLSSLIGSVNDVTNTGDTVCADVEQSNIVSSPFKDEAQRQQDFLNNTIEISPIKTMSPDRAEAAPSPEASSDYEVIKLSSPVHSNGDPFEKSASPEVFTEDKVAFDKRDQSPPRTEVNLTSTSPSSSLSLKKNKPQVRSNGRAAQMLGLCVADSVQPMINPEKDQPEEIEKVSNISPARRNLRILYNLVNSNTDSINGIGENNDNDIFLKFKRSLPAVDSSPSGSILKRKLDEIADDTSSPASKRKRVSFHDPPVSTTISVQKYIEPSLLRSPQNSEHKRHERQLRLRTPLKSPKKLDNVFKLDSVLTNTIESFSENKSSVTDDTQPISLDETPVVEVVRVTVLNDTDPICPELLDCKDSIEIIAGELSSPAMKLLLVKELEGKVETVGDLAKMTELEVNRLCIKAPKVKVVKQVLSDYANRRTEVVTPELAVSVDEAEFDASMTENVQPTKWVTNEVQTDSMVSIDVGLQTLEIHMSQTSAQTDALLTAHTSVQTDETGNKSTADIIKSCISERPDFVDQLLENLEESKIKEIVGKLPPKYISDYLVDKFAPEDLMIFFSDVIKSASGKLRKPSV